MGWDGMGWDWIGLDWIGLILLRWPGHLFIYKLEMAGLGLVRIILLGLLYDQSYCTWKYRKGLILSTEVPAAVRSWTKVRTWTFLNRTQSPVQGSNFAWTEPGVRFWVQGCVEFAELVWTTFEPEPLSYNSMHILCSFNYNLPHMVLIAS